MDRSSFLGASESSSVLGLNPFLSALKLYQIKIGLIDPDPPSNAMRRGNVMEPYILDLFTEETGLSVGSRQVEFIDHDNPFLVCHCDGLVKDGIVEAKSTNSERGWGQEGTDQIPQNYLIQTIVMMYLSGFKTTWVPVYFNFSDDFRIYKVERDIELEDLIIPRLVSFWKDHVEKRIPPDPVSLEDVKALFPKSEAKQVEATLEIAQAVVRLGTVKTQIKGLKDEQEKYESLIMQHMGICDELIYQGKTLATWRSKKRKAYEVKEGETRVLRIKTNKEE